MILTTSKFARTVIADLNHNMGNSDDEDEKELFGGSNMGFNRGILLGLIFLTGLLSLLGLYGVFISISGGDEGFAWSSLIASLVVAVVGFTISIGVYRQFTLMEQLHRLLPKLGKDQINSVLVEIISNDPSKDLVSKLLAVFEKIGKGK